METFDLFDTGSPEVLPVPDGDVVLFQSVELGESPDTILAKLIEEIHWRQEQITVWGKRHMQPRLLCWQGDSRQSYSYSGSTLVAEPFNQTVLQLKAVVEALTATRYNSVLLNYYRDNNDRMGFHSDDEPELGAQPTIASLSLGAERTFVMKHKRERRLKPIKIPLRTASLLLMRGDTQKNWLHGINRESAPCGPRINLTFRTIFEV